MDHVRLSWRDRVATLTLDRQGRHNALVPDLLDDLVAGIGAARVEGARALVLAGAGRSFSTGGDVGAFLDHADRAETLDAYAARTVGTLNTAILALLAFPAPVIARLHGPVTGGSVGLVLAADLVAMAPEAFIQPYYSEVGFAPDGGWTALLPDRVGAAAAMAIQALNRRIDAAEAVRLGLATTAVASDGIDPVIDGWLDALASKSAETLAATRRLVWDEARLAGVAKRLEAEERAFRALVGRPETIERMRTFTSRRRAAAGTP
ncbi:enoyl-CoA hydratase/isomerase family protein [Amorphus coralli]|uniref:enoyl-CoA hydratase/isomerase family protein n=1 Tax=Amorphus coralli TaxID=340680 RepID=UPI0003821558|nr:enoyl-CoA hydratase/isomerase family protein [Amorphus coralli]